MDFIHRVGRTARAGQPGLVTSLYTESNKDLVAAVRQAGKLGQPVVNFLSSFLFKYSGKQLCGSSYYRTRLWLQFLYFKKEKEKKKERVEIFSNI